MSQIWKPAIWIVCTLFYKHDLGLELEKIVKELEIWNNILFLVYK